MYEPFLGVNPWTALFILLNTLTIYFVAKKFLIGPVMKLIEDRQKEIDDMYAGASAALESAAATEQEYKNKLSTAMEAGERIVRDATVRGQEKEEQILRQANTEASRLLNKAAEEAAREKKKAINEAKNEISVIAVAIAEKVVARELNAGDHADLVERFINDLGDET